MGSVRSAVLLLCLPACGRWGFSDATPDASAVAADASPDAAPTLLACGQPSRFQIGASAVAALATVGSPNGFTMFTVDSAGGLHGWGYEFSGTTLIAKFENTAIDTGATGALATSSNGTGILLAAANGRPTATGMTVYPFDTSGVAAGAASPHAGELAVDRTIAASGGGTGYALATIAMGQTEVDAVSLAGTGADAASPVAIIPAAASADTVSLATAGTGYAAVWGQTASGMHAIEVELLDPQLVVTAGPIIVDDLGYGAYRGQVVWAAHANVYLASWHEKNAVGGDDVWMAILGPDLSPRVPATLVATGSHNAVVASDGDRFWMTWEVYASGSTTAHLDGAEVSATGAITARPVPSSGGTPGQWAMLQRDGQPVLVWTEVSGSGPDLYFDPMCSGGA